MLALTDPSLQMKVDPWQRSMPPLWPLHGIFVAPQQAGAKIKTAPKIVY